MCRISGSRFTVRNSSFWTAAQSPYVCFGCASAETTLLVPLPVVRDLLDSISVTKTDDRALLAYRDPEEAWQIHLPPAWRQGRP